MRTLPKLAAGVAATGVFLLAALARQDAPPKVAEKPPEMKFEEVKEIAPGVFFRYSSISATDKTIPFGGCNNTWVVFKDYVVVIDANFPKEAADVLAAIKKTTDKPVKYVLDTHHHGDHAYGNAVWAKAGAKVLSSKNCARLLKTTGPKGWEEAKKTDDHGVGTSELKQVDEVFDEKLVLEDDTQRVELLYLGHAHTSGDAVAYLPKHKILCTGDACVNGAFNYMGHSNSGSWIQCLEKMEKLDIKFVCPGHGKVATKDLLATQKRYFADMRAQIQKGVDGKKSLEDITAALDMPWYKEWTGKDAKEIKDNVEHVYKELTGKIDHDRLGLGSPNGWPYATPGDKVVGR
ncbi:MAG TPA: MBL fold metallo-hydrolase [Gemmataceae bacterium]|jgi:glyoxylase-like metal-dependent hydrolase (beta-lactamase superfamily II)|nr:MBL fold metallo-hydrolase [Gemmataceae bacterium]